MKKVLLIEDNQEMRENTSEILAFAGYKVVAAADGEKGVEAARKEKPDLVICDIMMPGLDGYGVLQTLSKEVETASIPFIFLTAKADRTDMRKGMNMGADDYLVKPFDETELINALETRLKRSATFRKEYTHDLSGLMQFISEAKKFSLAEALTKEYKVETFAKKAVVYEESNVPAAVYFVNKGKIKIWKMSSEGKEFITGVMGSGDFFGYIAMLEGTGYTDSATALEDAELARIPQSDFFSLIYSNNEVSARFIKLLAND